jgi:O-antigen ligase
MVYFLRHADFANFTFGDQSTSHRLYEAKIIISNFNNSNFFIKFLGNGFGSTIDLSGATDLTIASSNEDVNNVRNIHIGFFAVLSRYGILGCLIYVGFIFRMLFVCYKVLKKGSHYSVTLGCLYILILLFDSLISFPHMMSNFLFWYIVFIIFLEYKNGNSTFIDN